MVYRIKVKKVRIVRDDNSDTYKSVVIISDDHENQVVNLVVSLEGTPKPIQNPVKCNYESQQEDGDRIFVNERQLFDKNIGANYTAKTKMLNAAGKQIGDEQEFDVYIKAEKLKSKK